MRKFTLICTVLILTALFSSCGKKKAVPVPEEAPVVKLQNEVISWYYFSKDNFVKTDKPQNAPYLPMTPWTESVRISSANNAVGSEENQNRAFAVVNRLGILSFNGEEITLAPDAFLFSDRTCGNLVFLNDIPIFSVNKSAFFNDTITDPFYKSKDSQHLFLVQFDDAANISYPIINCNNLIKDTNSEVTDFCWDGLTWKCSIKTITDEKNIFSYVSWVPSAPLLSLSPNIASENITIDEIDVDTFRASKLQYEYMQAPARIKKLLEGFSSNIPFTLEVKTAGGCSPRIYVNHKEDSSKTELHSKAILSQSWSAALFEDGTLFMEGALPGKHILRQGRPIAIRLPRLPAGYVYSDFVISGTTLYAAWEETSFYKTSRSGFLQVNLENCLYSKLL